MGKELYTNGKSWWTTRGRSLTILSKGLSFIPWSNPMRFALLTQGVHTQRMATISFEGGEQKKPDSSLKSSDKVSGNQDGLLWRPPDIWYTWLLESFHTCDRWPVRICICTRVVCVKLSQRAANGSWYHITESCSYSQICKVYYEPKLVDLWFWMPEYKLITIDQARLAAWESLSCPQTLIEHIQIPAQSQFLTLYTYTYLVPTQ